MSLLREAKQNFDSITKLCNEMQSHVTNNILFTAFIITKIHRLPYALKTITEC